MYVLIFSITLHGLCFREELRTISDKTLTLKNATSRAMCKYWPQSYKTFFMLNSAEHEICPAN